MNTNKNKTSQWGVALILALFATVSIAADAAAGKAKAAMCQGCHGSDGVSKNPLWPILAGQTGVYLGSQLKAFKSGSRVKPTMTAIAVGLSDADVDNLAAYFASLAGQSAGGDAALVKSGQSKAGMCLGCHGEKGQGRMQFPRLAGQHPQYLVKQLNAFKNGTRVGGPMGGVAKTLSDQDILALAAYFGSL